MRRMHSKQWIMRYFSRLSIVLNAFGTCKMRRLEQALYMDRNTIPNINTTRFAFEQNIKYNTRRRLDILQFPTFIILRVFPFDTTLQCQ